MALKPTITNSHLWATRLPSNTQIVNIHWRDITDVSNWNEDEEVAPYRYLQQIGYLLYQGPDPKDDQNDMTVIAAGYDGDQNKWYSFTVFPSSVIRKMVAITKKKKAGA